jgi:hypothetical protein
MNMRHLETYDESKAETDDTYKGITYDIDHLFTSLLSLPGEFVNDRDQGISIGTLSGNLQEPSGIIHIQNLVTEEHAYGKCDNPDTCINQKISEQICQSASS